MVASRLEGRANRPPMRTAGIGSSTPTNAIHKGCGKSIRLSITNDRMITPTDLAGRLLPDSFVVTNPPAIGPKAQAKSTASFAGSGIK